MQCTAAKKKNAETSVRSFLSDARAIRQAKNSMDFGKIIAISSDTKRREIFVARLTSRPILVQPLVIVPSTFVLTTGALHNLWGWLWATGHPLRYPG